MKPIPSTNTLRALMKIFAVHGLTELFISGNREFCSHLFKELSSTYSQHHPIQQHMGKREGFV